MKNIALILITLFSITGLTAQTASQTLGCFPLPVDFTSPNATNNYWEFGDGNFSNLKDPSHNYITPGVYIAELFEGVGGPKVGEIEITVLAPPEIMIGASERLGCSPFEVQFTNESIIDPNANVTGYFWDFGDGGNSTAENPIYTYQNENIYAVSLRIESSLDNCEDTETFTEYIEVTGSIDAGLSVDNTVFCDAPATVNITNNTIDLPGYTYEWDLGNGQTSTDINPPAANYDSDGTYQISMTVDNNEGCVVTLSRLISVGKPKFDIMVPDTVCIRDPFTAVNETEPTATSIAWDFGPNAMPQFTNLRNPIVLFTAGGAQSVTLSVTATTGCVADTTFTIYVDDPNAAFTIDPIIQCFDQSTYKFIHPQSGMKEYSWYIRELDTTVVGGPEFDFTYNEPFRDSFYISRIDTFTVLLSIETQFGCEGLDSLEFYHRAPRAHFVPDVSRGCAPLTINFDEVSESYEDIISWDWVFGDGQEASTNTPDDMTHTYTEPGEYYVKLTIENDVGCRDTSEGVWIYVGEPIDSDFTFDKTEICLNDSVSFEALNLDPRIDAWHFDTDGSRISHCFEAPDATHAFVHAPGTYPVTLTIEYNGCFNEIDNGETITVNGSKSIIKFMTNCEDPYTVMFQDSSLNATTAIWYINGDVINMDTIAGDSFNYTFDETGDYEIKLWTDDDTMCDPDSSMVNVYIRDIEANFELPKEVCAYAPIDIDASASVDVDNTCSKGYEWFGVARRPRQVDYPVMQAAYFPGPITVRLVVEDLNGCKDTLEKTSRAYEVRADFLPSRERVCDSSLMSFTDISVGDTTIVKWEWSFDSEEQNPMDELIVTGGSPFVPIELKVEDLLGCTDSIIINIPVYLPVTDIEFLPDSIVCIGDSIHITATDFTQQGSFLNYDWSFGVNGSEGTSMEQNPSILVNTPGTIPVTLTIEEDSTGCTNEYTEFIIGIRQPIADFEVDVDEDGIICPEEIVAFNNNSFLDGGLGGYLWDFGNGSTAFGENPTTFLDTGTYEIILTVSSIYGCSDKDTALVTLQGPKGDFTIDKDIFCIGETVTFELIDSLVVDVESYYWDFGDGDTTENVNPVAHPYTFLPDVFAASLDVTLTLTSPNGCEVTREKSIEIITLFANFGIVKDTMNFCNKEIQFIDSSLGSVDSYFWDFGNGETSTEQNPTLTYTENYTPEDSLMITLTVDSNNGLCESIAIKSDTVEVLSRVEYPNVFSPNNDQRNDYFDIILPEEERECVEVVRCKIFNRWGNMIYNNELPPEGWDGRFEGGENAPAEVYTYILEVVYYSGEVDIEKGRFTLIR